MTTPTAKTTPQTLGAAVPATNGKHVPSPKDLFEHFTMDELELLPEMKWIVENMLPHLGLGIIYGPSGNGKTFVVIDLGCALVKGDFLFAKEFGIHGSYTVAYCAGEKFHGIPKRMLAAKRHWALTEEQRSRFHIYKGVPQLFDNSRKGNADEFIAMLKEYHPGGLDVLFIDTYHAATLGSNENDGRDAGLIIEQASKIRDALGCAVIFVHHAGASNQRERGHTSPKAAVDMVLKVEKDKDSKGVLIITCEKMGDADDDFSLTAKLTEIEGVDSRALTWDGRFQKSKDLTQEVLRILKSNYAKWLSAKEVHESVVLDEQPTEKAVATSLTRQWAIGAEKTGVHRRLSDESKKPSRTNPYEFMYDRSAIAHDPEPPPPYDPFEDE